MDQVHDIVVYWTDGFGPEEKRSEPIGKIIKDKDRLSFVLGVNDELGHRHVFAFPVAEGPAQAHEDGRMINWSLLKLGSTVWKPWPSYHVPGQIHAYLTLVNVPDPPPWKV